MAKVIVLCGPSGSGKTYTRTHDPALVDLPYLDIADIYREARERFGISLDWETALSKLLRDLRVLLRQTDVVVIEGYFLPRSKSRRVLEEDARVGGYSLEYRQHYASPETCARRIMAQYEAGECTWEEADTRIKMMLRVVDKEAR